MKSRVALGTVLIAAAMLAACDKVPLLAPRESSISVTSQSLSLPPGGTTTVTALVMESGGNAVHDGTRVSFSATLGRVEPAEVETRGGTATTTFVAGSTSGTAQVRAMSGAATASGGTGENQTAGNIVQIAIGGAATTAVTVSASPSRVPPSGGTVTIVGSALDAAGNRLVGVPISFSADVGRLSASSALTDGSGEARVTLTTDRQAVVTARSGGQNATVTVTVATAATVGLLVAPAAPQVNSPVTLTVTPVANTSPRVIVNWGDGSTEDLGVVPAVRTAAHIYRSAGAFTITATASADGETFTTSVAVLVASQPAFGITVAATPASPNQCDAVSLTATTTGDTTASIREYRWTIESSAPSENETVTTSGNVLVRVWQYSGRKTISVTATTTDGRTGNGQTQVAVREVPTSPSCQ